MSADDQTIRVRDHFGFRVVDIPETRRSLHKTGDGVVTCWICGKKLGHYAFAIVACAGWLNTLAPHAAADVLAHKDPGFMGGGAIGSDCAGHTRAFCREAGVDPAEYVVPLGATPRRGP